MLIRRLAVAALVLALVQPSLLKPSWAQAPSAPAPAAKPPAVAKKAAAKPAAKKAAAKPAAAVDSGPCDMGVITATHDLFTVQKIGLTVFNNEFAEMPVNWGLDDLIYARVKAAGGAGVRRITYDKQLFDNFEKPKLFFLREESETLTGVVKQIVASAGCRRYLVIQRQTSRVGNTNQNVTGFGILQMSAIFTHTFIFAYLDIKLLDGETFETLRNPNFTVQRVVESLGEGLVKIPGMHDADDSLYPTVAADAANNARLRDAIRRLVTEQLDRDMPAYFKVEER
ncbi:hypothetical protein SSBR45G_26570 [Bradyrhizobium sp. SSBR45G]|nr:hypothetical protein SSBR45G_26570 [Bradyrhizobium sp. SSBR45G]GLH84986.1 hypothetical protein SSBR45R_24460 [Bradyrhizobium sp. SSBR45R]